MPIALLHLNDKLWNLQQSLLRIVGEEHWQGQHHDVEIWICPNCGLIYIDVLSLIYQIKNPTKKLHETPTHRTQEIKPLNLFKIVVIQFFDNALVTMSASWCSMSILIIPLVAFSQTKWQFASMCLVLSWNTGFEAYIDSRLIITSHLNECVHQTQFTFQVFSTS